MTVKPVSLWTVSNILDMPPKKQRTNKQKNTPQKATHKKKKATKSPPQTGLSLTFIYK